MQNTGKVFIIAEAGVNHNGSLDTALRLVDVAAEAGADAVKFQTFSAEKLVAPSAPKADYQMKTTDRQETQLEMLKRYELDEQAHDRLIDRCRCRGIRFMSTPFDAGSADLLIGKYGLPCIKISSGDITNAPLLLKVAKSGVDVILSTGMSTLSEVEIALGVLAFGYSGNNIAPLPAAFQAAFSTASGQEHLAEKVTLLHCTTEYPAAFDEVNLLCMDTMKAAFRLRVGLSDHTPGVSVAIAAAARGAAVVEKHFTLDKGLPGPDHKASLEPCELKGMVEAIRQVEKSIGSGVKVPVLSETKNRAIARKSLVASKAIRKGEAFSQHNIDVRRPGGGIAPLYYWDWLGRSAPRDYREGELL